MSKKPVRIEVTKPGEAMSVAEMAIPQCPPQGLVLKTHSSGICHSDVHLWRDQWIMHDGKTVSLKTISDKVVWPMIMGHEVSGEVYALGSQSTKGAPDLKVGDIVVVFPWIGCGECGVCKIGATNDCPNGGVPTDIGLGVVHGGYQSYVAITDRKYVVKLPNDIPTTVGCMFGCSALTAYHACSRVKTSVERAAKGGGAKFLIVGAGGLGLWCIQIAKALFPSNTKVIVADIADDKLKLAKEHGADQTILWPKDEKTPALIEKTKAEVGGIDGAVDFVGVPSTLTTIYESTNNGANMSVVGLCGGTFPVPGVTLALRDITISGTYVGNRQQLVDLVDLYKAKKLKPPPLIHVSPEEANDAIHKLYAGQITGRAIINFK